MQYLGGKARIGKALSICINTYTKEKTFYEPFCGACNITQHIKAKKVYASDICKEIIELHKHVQLNGPLPESVSEEEYAKAKANKDTPDWLKAFIGYGCSFAGGWFGGYARSMSNGKKVNFAKRARDSLVKKHKKLKNVIFNSCSYEDIKINQQNEQCVMYCDIPYKGTKEYKIKFNHTMFYKWAKQMHEKGHTVIVSEYKCNIPKNWDIIFEMESKKAIRGGRDFQDSTIEILMKPTI